MTNRMIRCLILFCLFIPSFLPASVDISGYLENRFYLVVDPGAAWNDWGEKFSLGDYNRLRLILDASPSEKVHVNVAVDFFTFFGFITSPLGTVGGSASSEPDDLKIDLDRAYVDLYFKHFDLSVGKQRIALGVSYLWAPLDIFNRVNILEPKEEKPGANALKIYVPLGASSSLIGVFSPDDHFDSSKYAIRGKTQMYGVDMAFTLIRSGLTDTMVYGMDLRGENFIGWWVEAGYFDRPDQNAAKMVIGFDYTFPVKNGIYWLNEFFYDASGEADKEKYDYASLASGERFTLARHYLFSMLRYGFFEFLSVSLAYIGNWDDGSVIINPAIQYDLSQNVSLSGGFYFPIGRPGGEFNTVYSDETKNRAPSIFFIWLKVNF
jgi:hypothetical protein